MVAPPTLNRLSVNNAVAKYLGALDRAVTSGDLSPTTVANYQRDLAEFTELAGAETILDDLTGEDLDDLVVRYGSKPDHRFKNPAGRTRSTGATSRFRQSISRLFSHATKAGWVQANPVPDMTVKLRTNRSTKAARRTALQQSSATALLATPVPTDKRPDQRLDARDRFILSILMEVGPRVSELCLADRADITTDDSGVTWFDIRHAKGGKPRRVPLSQTTQGFLTDYDLTRPTPKPRMVRDKATGEMVETVPVGDAEQALLLTWRGVRMKPRDVQLMVNRRVAQMPAEARREVTPHGLRHTAATLLLASGAADVMTVRDLLGHASISTTSAYLDGADASMVAAVRSHPVTTTT